MPRSASTATWYLRFPVRAATADDAAARAPLVERVLARAAARAAAADWRREAFELVAAPGERWPGLAPAAAHRAFGALDAAAVFLATPVAYLPTLTRLHLAPDGLLAIEPAEAARLAADHDAAFAPARRLLAAPDGRLFCVFQRLPEVATCDPAGALGGDVGAFQPSGPGAAALRLAASELEMWLHTHPLNRAREKRGHPPIAGLWLWGGGVPLERAPRLAGFIAGEDPLCAAFAPPGAQPAPPALAHERRDGVVCVDAAPGSAQWPHAEHWLGAALAALAERRIGRIVLRAGAQAFEYGPAEHRRFWRRARPWWERLA